MEDKPTVEPEISFAGRHLLLDVWEAQGLDQLPVVEKALRDAVEACGATLLEIKLHVFSPTNGISGVAIVSESHISIHTWPEWGYAALDVFLCNKLDPHKAIPVFSKAFQTTRIQVMEAFRGMH
jgi:S-adenosylmethionine decarboxylase